MNNELDVLAPKQFETDSIHEWLSSIQPQPCFAPITLQFIESMSRKLLAPEIKRYPELVALGFWLRTLIRDESKITHSRAFGLQKPLGLVAHFTPSNVDTMFIYSWVCGLLMGNCNIIRVSTQSTEMQQTLFEILNQLFSLSEYQAIAQRNLFVQFDKTSHWSASISKFVDARVMWGGDESVQTIRNLPTKPRAREISFADRYSACVINGEHLDPLEIKSIAAQYWNDIKLFQQQACSSPRVLFWCGEKASYKRFVECLLSVAELDHTNQRHIRNEQLVTAQAIVGLYGGGYQFSGPLCLVEPKQYISELIDIHNGFYVSLVVKVDALAELANYIDEKAQTLTYAGFSQSEMLQFMSDLPINGIDRIVPIGQALDFETVWDGFDLLESLSRHVSVK